MQTAPSPLLRALYEFCPQRVAINVSQNRQRMLILLNRETLEPALIQRPGSNAVMMRVPAIGVRHRQQPHELTQITIARREKHKVKVVGHRHITANPDGNALVSELDAFFERFIVTRFAKDRRPSNGTVQRVIQDPARSDAKSTCHRPKK